MKSLYDDKNEITKSIQYCSCLYLALLLPYFDTLHLSIKLFAFMIIDRVMFSLWHYLVNYFHDLWFNGLSNLYRNKWCATNPLLPNYWYCTSCSFRVIITSYVLVTKCNRRVPFLRNTFSNQIKQFLNLFSLSGNFPSYS